VISLDEICQTLQQNNVFTVARRTVDGQELLYHSIKYTNQVYILSELKMQKQNTTLTVSSQFNPNILTNHVHLTVVTEISPSQCNCQFERTLSIAT
jgi:hypothetical protein